MQMASSHSLECVCVSLVLSFNIMDQACRELTGKRSVRVPSLRLRGTAEVESGMFITALPVCVA